MPRGKKFERGEVLDIHGLVDEIDAGRWVIVRYGNGKERPQHHTFLAHQNYRTLRGFAMRGRVFKAIDPKDDALGGR